MQNINARMASGIVWMVAARLMDRGIGMFSTLILARLLVPADFGLVAMATVIGGVLDLLGAFSFDMALIQHKNAERRHYDTVWTMNLIFGLFCAAALVGLAIPASHFYREPRLEAVMYVLSISYLVGAFNNVGVVAFRKDLDFGKEFKFIFARRIITFTVTVVAAWLFRSYWALLLGMTVGRVASVLLSYTMNAYRPRLNMSAARELFHFSKWLFVNNALFFMFHDGATFIIGRLYGPTELGIYAVAYEISSLPSTELAAPINRATFPGFSKMKELEEIATSYLKLLGMMTLLILPVGVGIAAVAETLVQTLLGDKWLAAIPLIQLLALHGAVGATQGNNSTVWMAMGRPRNTTLLAALFLVVLFPALYFLLKSQGIVGAGYAYLLSTAATLPYSLGVTKHLLRLRWRDVWSVSWRPLAGVSLMYLSALALDGLLRPVATPIVRLVVVSAAGALIYAGAVLGMWRAAGLPAGAEAYITAAAKARLGRGPKNLKA